MSNLIYRIRHKQTGLFSKGGTHSGSYLWSKKGKTWSNIGAVKNHLYYHLADGAYEDAEIIGIEVKYEESVKIPVSDIIFELEYQRQQERLEMIKRQRAWVEEQERKKLAELKVKYEGV